MIATISESKKNRYRGEDRCADTAAGVSRARVCGSVLRRTRVREQQQQKKKNENNYNDDGEAMFRVVS